MPKLVVRPKLVVLLSPLLLLVTVAAAAQPAPDVTLALEDLTRLAGGPVDTVVSPRSGRVTFLSATPGAPIPAPGRTPEERARAFLADHGALFGVRSTDELVTRRVKTGDAVGMDHVRFRQTVAGIPVTGGEVGVHLRGNELAAVHARALVVPAELVTTPALTRETAREAALAALSRDHDPQSLELGPGRLEVLDRGHLGGPPAPARTAWFFEARRIDVREYVWIDAGLGTVLLRFSQLAHGKNRQIYDALDPTDGVYDDLPGILVRSEGQGDTGDPDADDAYHFSGDTYDYFSTVHGRDSFDDAGGTLVSTTHFCPSSASCPYANAFWDGVQMVYGEGFSAADDVAAHELTHAVTEHTATLFYYMQSGALNESYSDIFGETVDLTNTGGTDTSGVRWLLGEDVPGFGAVRDMMNPQDLLDPAKLSDPEFVCATPGGDAGGVHSNSGVPNHAYALMVDGGVYNGMSISGVGLDKAARIQYRALSEYLLSSSGFLDNVAALQQACSDLVGTAGITSGDCTEVDQAVAAVEMADAWPCGAPAAAPVCGAGELPTDLFYDDFEEIAGGSVNDPTLLSHWTQSVFAGFSHWNLCCLGAFASSGTGNLFGFNLDVTADSALQMNADVTLPSDAFVHFNHSYGFENSGTTYWDGGVIEISTDGGGSWQDAGGLVSDGAGYTGTLQPSNPLAGRSAFTAESYGYTATRLDLANYAGEDVRFRFRIGTDAIVSDYGWFIDDFRIYACGAGCTPVISLTTGTVTGVESHIACTSITAGGSFVVGGTGDLTLEAPTVVLADGFSVLSGGRLEVRTN
jgi:Zn-dependent metalloprotease